MAGFRRAIAATPNGGTLLIRARGADAYTMDTSGGLTQALTIDRPMTVRLDGIVRVTDGTSRPNPPYLFDVRAPDVRFEGRGAIAGPGIEDDTNDHEDRNHAGLIYVRADRFQFVGPTVRDVPKIGIHLWACHDATISARFSGGIANYTRGHTGLFGIRATGGGRHRIVDNRFERDGRGARLITGYFAGGIMGETRGDLLARNVADVHEKLAYLYTSDSRVVDCRVRDATQTDIVRLVGSDNLVKRLVGERVMGGVSIYNGAGNRVEDCAFRDVCQAGIFLSFLGDYKRGYAGTVIAGNTIIGAADATGLQDGICLYLAGGDTSGVTVARNRIAAAGAAAWRNAIRVESIPPYFADDIAVVDNDLSGSVNGSSLRRVRRGRVERNVARVRGNGAALLQIDS